MIVLFGIVEAVESKRVFILKIVRNKDIVLHKKQVNSDVIHQHLCLRALRRRQTTGEFDYRFCA